ncbi:DUF2971 domain-containing protein [Thalassospira alkalitolerans]|uniref:DUF2971 domain-containing protein n=1 Tax=Thalassospira alkalitolerans TaxID=1293890 RepID=UPI003AA807B5
MKQLFKYMSAPWDLFANGYIRLTQISALNDPFEALFCRSGLDTLSKEFDDNTVLGNLSFSDYIDRDLNKVGVISLSENKENFLMWAHYANEHKGLVAGISYFPDVDCIPLFEHLLPEHSLFSPILNENYSLFDGNPKPVLYRKSPRYRNDKFDYDYSNISAQSGGRCLYEVCMQKSDEWIYEQEHRIVLRLEQADKVICPQKIMDKVHNLDKYPYLDKLIDSSILSLNTMTNENEYSIYLSNIEDDIERIIYAKFLSRLSKHREVIYLMKLSAESINNCIFGLKSDNRKKDSQFKYAASGGSLDFWQTKKCQDHYGLEFEQT